MRSQAPDLSGFSGFAQVQAGSDANLGAMGAVNIPISDTLGIRIAGVGGDGDHPLVPERLQLGHRAHGVGEARVVGLRGSSDRSDATVEP